MLVLQLERRQLHGIAGGGNLVLESQVVEHAPRHGVVAVLDEHDVALALGVDGCGDFAGSFPDIEQVGPSLLRVRLVADVELDVVINPFSRLGGEYLHLLV